MKHMDDAVLLKLSTIYDRLSTLNEEGSRMSDDAKSQIDEIVSIAKRLIAERTANDTSPME